MNRDVEVIQNMLETKSFDKIAMDEVLGHYQDHVTRLAIKGGSGKMNCLSTMIYFGDPRK